MSVALFIAAVCPTSDTPKCVSPIRTIRGTGKASYVMTHNWLPFFQSSLIATAFRLPDHVTSERGAHVFDLSL